MRSREEALAALNDLLAEASSTGNLGLLLSDEAGHDARDVATAVTSAPRSFGFAASRSLGFYHWYRYLARPQGDGHGDDLSAAIRYLSPAYRANPAAVPEELRLACQAEDPRASTGPDAMSIRASGLLGAALQSGDEQQLLEAVALLWVVVADTPVDHPERAERIHLRGIALRRLYERTGNTGYLVAAVEAGRDAVAASAASDPHRAGRLSTLANALHGSFEHTGEEQLLDEAADAARAAVDASPVSDPGHPVYLSNLAGILYSLFRQNGDRDTLREAVRAATDAVNTTPHDNHPQLAMHLNGLGILLDSLFRISGDPGVLADAIEAGRSAVALTPADHVARAAYLNNLGNALRALSVHTGDADALNEAIQTWRDAAALFQAGHPSRCAVLDNLASALQVLFERTGDASLLAEAAQALRDAVAATPPDRSDRFTRLTALATLLQAQFGYTQEISLLDEAIQAWRDAAAIVPDDHPGHAAALESLHAILVQRDGGVAARPVPADAEWQAAVRPLVPRAEGRPISGGSPAALLRPDRQIVPFSGRDAEILTLESWADDSAPRSVRLVIGPGGSGKKRLAVELAQRLHARGWRCGLPKPGHGDRAIRSIRAAGQPTLLVVDHAEARADIAPLLSALAAYQGEPTIRVLLLARALSRWWQTDGPLCRDEAVANMLTGAEPVPVGPLSYAQQGNQAILDTAVRAFAEHHGVSAPSATLPSADGGYPVLWLHAAALTAVLDARQGTATTEVRVRPDVAGDLLRHEARYWEGAAAAHRLAQLGLDSSLYPQAVAVTGLIRATDQAQAEQTLRRLPALAGASRETIAAVMAWLRQAYPPDGSSWSEPLGPGLLLEYLVTTTLGGAADLAAAVLSRDLSQDQAERVLALLAHAMADFSEEHPAGGPGLAAAAAGLLRQLLTASIDALVLPAVRLACNLLSPDLNHLIADTVVAAPIARQTLAALTAELTPVPVPAIGVLFAVQFRKGLEEIARGEFRDAVQTAASLLGVAHDLEEHDAYAAGASARSAQVGLYQALDQAEPGIHGASLAAAMDNFAIALRRLGENGQAEAAHAEAVRLYRALDQAEPGRHREDLAMTLGNLGGVIATQGRESEAEPVLREALETYRALEQSEPGHHREPVALAAGNLGAALTSLGRQRAAEAEALLRESVDLYRDLEHAEPGRHLRELARFLNNLGISLKAADRDDEAEPILAEATDLVQSAEQNQPWTRPA